MWEVKYQTQSPLYVALEDDDETLLPVRADRGSVGYDLRSTQDFEIYPGQTYIVGTGVYPFFMGNDYATVYSRSGLSAKHSIFVVNAPGLIDTSYRGEICVIMHRLDIRCGCEPVIFNRGDRIAQLVIQPDPMKPLTHVTVDQFNKMVTSEEGNVRGTGGFGSTGV